MSELSLIQTIEKKKKNKKEMSLTRDYEYNIPH